MLSHELPIVHNYITPTMPYIPLHSSLEHTNKTSATVPLASSTLDKADSPITSLNIPLVIPSLLQDNAITDVYMVDTSGNPIQARASNLFLTVPILHGPQGEKVQFLAIVNNGAMINVIDVAAFQWIA
jgi:hypothetical protein